MPSKRVKYRLYEIYKRLVHPEMPEALLFSNYVNVFVMPALKDEKGANGWNEFIARFEQVTTHDERVGLILNDQCLRSVLDGVVNEFLEDRDFHGKSNSKAKEARKAGNVRFGAKKYEQALQHYSLALSLASQEVDDVGNEYALALGNRSASLYYLNMYKESLYNIEQALKHGYPHQKRQKLIERKTVCLNKLGVVVDSPSATVVIDKPLTALSQVMPEVIKEPNLALPGASNAVKLAYCAKKGRHLILQKDVKTSEVLLMETAYANWLTPRKYDEFCYHCLTKLYHCHVPCKQCSLVRFCSEVCAQKAWNEYHGIECSHMDVFKLMDDAHFAFKCICKAGLENAVRATRNGPYKFERAETDYEKLLTLVDHAERIDLNIMLESTAMAVFVVLLIERLPCKKLSEDETVIGGLILKHLRQLSQNSFLIFHYEKIQKFDYSCNTGKRGLHVQIEDGKLIETSQKRIPLGSGIYCTISLLSHTCGLEDVYKSFYGSTLVLKACKEIQSGEEICINYGFDIFRHRRKERQKLIKDAYNFTCECTYCSMTDQEVEAMFGHVFQTIKAHKLV